MYVRAAFASIALLILIYLCLCVCVQVEITTKKGAKINIARTIPLAAADEGGEDNYDHPFKSANINMYNMHNMGGNMQGMQGMSQVYFRNMRFIYVSKYDVSEYEIHI